MGGEELKGCQLAHNQLISLQGRNFSETKARKGDGRLDALYR